MSPQGAWAPGISVEARSLAPGLVFAFALPVLAGCLASPQPLGEAAAPPLDARGLLERLSKPIYERVLHEALSLRSFDGTLLSIELYRPETPPEVKVPTSSS